MSFDYLYGKRLVEAVISYNVESIHELLVEKKKLSNYSYLSDKLNKNNIKICGVDRNKIYSMVGDVNHQGIIAICEKIATKDESFLHATIKRNSSAVFLILDEIDDPQNLGAIIRTAAAAKVDAVVISKNRGASLSSTVRKVSAGGSEIVNIVEVSNLSQTMEKLKSAGVWLYGADSNTQNVMNNMEFTFPCGLVMGNEGKGLRRLTKEKCDFLMKIPFNGLSSVNVSVATGICLYAISST